MSVSRAQVELMGEIAKFYADPYSFVLFAWPWRQPGTFLEHHAGPDGWQKDFLIRLGAEVSKRGFDGITPVDPIRMAVASGHGIGKGVLSAWLTCWILATRPGCKGTITAGSWQQLRTKTWATFTSWLKSSAVASMFEVTTDKAWFKTAKDSWFVSAQSCDPANSEGFAGQHATDSSSFYVFDEASAIDDKIWEVSEGGLSDGEPMLFAFGNPTRGEGAFHRACFGSDRHRWIVQPVSSWASRFTNKHQLGEWRDSWGEDSDFYRVRVLGEPPRRGSFNQFIPADVVAISRKHEALVYEGLPKVFGVDVARQGDDRSVIVLRQGRHAQVLGAWRGLDTVQVAERVIEFMSEHAPDAIVVDGDGIGAGTVDQLKHRGFTRGLHEFHGGGKPNDPNAYYNRRAEVWGLMRDALKADMQIPDTLEWETDLCGVTYSHTAKDQIQLEPKESMKSRGLDSPDLADALAMTYAVIVAARNTREQKLVYSFPGERSLIGWLDPCTTNGAV